MTASAPVPQRADRARPRTVAIVAALDEELAGFRTCVALSRPTERGRCRVRTGELGGVPVVLARTGAGEAAARAGIEALLELHPVERLAIVGLSGAVDPELAPGTVFVARRVIDATVEPARDVLPGPDAGWVAAAARAGVPVATAISVARIVGPGEKAAARATAATTPAAVDLESATWARAAGRRGIPYAVFRAISDGADEELPLDFERCRRSDGTLSRARVVASALARPASLAPLWKLKRRIDGASQALAERVATWIVEERA
jgi:adenosylhomocysteine nucleosidase